MTDKTGTGVDERAMKGMSVAPPEPGENAEGEKGKTIEERLKENPESKEARLDKGLEGSMDGSDPPASTQPVHRTEPAPSSGYDEEKERKLREEKGE